MRDDPKAAPSTSSFLDTIGAGTVSGAAPRPRARSGLATAALPVVATLAALAAVALAGLSQRSPLPEAMEPYAYGYFLDRYPLFAFALVYGIARLACVAAEPGPASAPRRLLFALAGVAALGLAGLYPTFGGLILRGGFATGGMAFLTGQPLWLAYALGSGVAAAGFGGIVGGFSLAASRPLRPSFLRVGRGILGFLALWFGAIVVGLAHGLGFGSWPHRGLRPAEAALAALLLLAAAAPHAGLGLLRRARSPL